jgi:hypothetical protein
VSHFPPIVESHFSPIVESHFSPIVKSFFSPFVTHILSPFVESHFFPFVDSRIFLLLWTHFFLPVWTTFSFICRCYIFFLLSRNNLFSLYLCPFTISKDIIDGSTYSNKFYYFDAFTILSI